MDVIMLVYTSIENVCIFWLIIGVVFLFMELGVPGLFFFLAFTMGSCGAALFSLFSPSIVLQCIIFLITSGVAFLFMKKYVYTNQIRSIRTNVHALIGKQGVVTKKIHRDSPGRVKIGGEEWSAYLLDNEALSSGAHVVVVQVKGNHVKVKPL